jgi:hypothetical protein
MSQIQPWHVLLDIIVIGGIAGLVVALVRKR